MGDQTKPAPRTVEILIAEDSPTQAEQLRYVLEQRGYRVTVAENGRQALAILSEHQPSLVISDIAMPEMDGFELCQRLRADVRTRHMPVVLLTALSDTEDVLQSLVCGADSLITKPYSDDYLLTHVERTLAGRSPRSSEHSGSEVEIQMAGESRVVTTDPQRMLSLLLSTYEAAVHRNTELAQTQDELRSFRERQEDLVEERTAALSAEIVERKNAEETLQHHSERETLIAGVSTLFVQLPPDEVDRGIDSALQAVGEFSAADRSYVIVLSEDGTKLDNTHEWCAEGIAPQIENRKELPIDCFPWCAERLGRLRIVYAPQLEAIRLRRVTDLPPEACDERKLLEAQGVQSLIAAPMVCASSLVGFVGLDSVRTEKAWPEDVSALLSMMGGIFVNALERRRAHEQIQSSLKEKVVLLQEVHHRVKNNLQVVSSLLKLRSDYSDDPRVLDALRESQNRVKSMALVHEWLYSSQDMANVDFGQYVRSLAKDLFRSYNVQASGITLKVEVSDAVLDIDRATPCGLIVNELISNALKHAFPDGRSGEICVGLRSSDGLFALTVRDNGVGLAQDLDLAKTDSLGLKLVRILTKQLKGTFIVNSDGGAEFGVTFPALYDRE